MYQGEGAECEFVARVIKDLKHYERHGRFPRVAFRARTHDREAVQDRLTYMRRRSYARWSKRLMRDDLGRCSECNRPKRKGFGVGPMVHDELWSRLVDDKDTTLCDRCFRRVLGRPVCLHDLRICLMNVDQFRWLGGAPWTPQAGEFYAYFDLIPVDTWTKVRPGSLLKLIDTLNAVEEVFGGIANVSTTPVEHEAYSDMQMIFLNNSFKELFLCQPVEGDE